MSDTFNRKVQELITGAIVGLSTQDRDERIAHCRESGQHGVRMHEQGDSLVFSWGNRTLVAIERYLLTDDSAVIPPGQFVPEIGDTVPDKWL